VFTRLFPVSLETVGCLFLPKPAVGSLVCISSLSVQDPVVLPPVSAAVLVRKSLHVSPPLVACCVAPLRCSGSGALSLVPCANSWPGMLVDPLTSWVVDRGADAI